VRGDNRSPAPPANKIANTVSISVKLLKKWWLMVMVALADVFFAQFGLDFIRQPLNDISTFSAKGRKSWSGWEV
jgi:hypothetical protein